MMHGQQNVKFCNAKQAVYFFATIDQLRLHLKKKIFKYSKLGFSFALFPFPVS